jgi:hypothetical protein
VIEEERMPGRTSGVVRRDAAVHKRSAPWSTSVDAMLEHLVARGFAHAPRPLGRDDAGRQVLSRIEGTVPGGPDLGSAWTAESLAEPALIAAARPLRELHEALVGFDPPDPVWMYHGRCRISAGQIVGHGDIGPWNTVYRDGAPVAFIDFDSAGPTHPVIEAAQAAWAFVPIVSDTTTSQRFDLDHLNPINRALVFAQAYGIEDPALFLAALPIARAQQAAHAQRWPVDAAAIADYLNFTAADLNALAQRTPELLKAFGVTSASVDEGRTILLA